ncbi:MAG: PTS fructose transporter subunit IIB [Vibrio sp.]
MKIVAVTACPTGIAHTYMAAEELKNAANALNLNIHIETQGAMGIENKLSIQDIMRADVALIVSDIDIEQAQRFDAAKHLVHLTIESVLLDAPKCLQQACQI